MATVEACRAPARKALGVLQINAYTDAEELQELPLHLMSMILNQRTGA